MFVNNTGRVIRQQIKKVLAAELTVLKKPKAY